MNTFSEIGSAAVRYLVPVTFTCFFIIFTIQFGLGKVLRYIAAWIWAAGEAIDAGWLALTSKAKSSFAEAREHV